MLERLAQLLYLMAPAYLANMTPPFTRFWRGWNRPINERWLGSHKTVVGAAAGVVMGVAAAFAQAKIAWQGSLVRYEYWPVLGLMFGIGAIGGDMVKSFVKRRAGIAPGRPWIPWDQLDFVLGALLLIAPWADIGWGDAVLVVVVSFVGDIAVNRIAFWLGIRDTAL